MRPDGGDVRPPRSGEQARRRAGARSIWRERAAAEDDGDAAESADERARRVWLGPREPAGLVEAAPRVPVPGHLGEDPHPDGRRASAFRACESVTNQRASSAPARPPAGCRLIGSASIGRRPAARSAVHDLPDGRLSTRRTGRAASGAFRSAASKPSGSGPDDAEEDLARETEAAPAPQPRAERRGAPPPQQ